MNKVYSATHFSMAEGELNSPLSQVSERDFLLELKLPFYRPWKVGQFVMLRWGDHVVGRPFAILDWEKISSTESLLKVWFRALGPGTHELSEYLKKQKIVVATLPLGQVPDAVLNAKSILFISGGVGAASVWPMARERKKQGCKDFWVHGERNEASLVKSLDPDLCFLEEPSKKFPQGRVTKIFEDPALLENHKLSDFDAVLTCGPSPMLQALQKLALHFKELPFYMGLEEKMACGLGLCFSCSVKTKEGMQRCCLEGPWFESCQIPDHFEFRSQLPPKAPIASAGAPS